MPKDFCFPAQPF